MPARRDRLSVVIFDASLCGYLQGGGGHWAWGLQLLLGLNDLCSVTWVEWLQSTGDTAADEARMIEFYARMRRHGIDDRCVVLIDELGVDADPTLDSARVVGSAATTARELLAGADVVWSLAEGLPEGLLDACNCSVLIDVDPGHLQGAALMEPTLLDRYDRRFTVGSNVGRADCRIPELGLTWHPFLPPIYLPMWQAQRFGEASRRVTSVTHWNWDEQSPIVDGEVWSTSKRRAYLRYVALPSLCTPSFELVAKIWPEDGTGDYDVLTHNGWALVDPLTTLSTVDDYQAYIHSSWAELCCPKPVYRQLRTGWLSDRSAAYLASGRPVVMEDTGLGAHIPTGEGLLTFDSYDSACEAFIELDRDYERHSVAARRLVEDHLDSRRVLGAMLEAL